MSTRSLALVTGGAGDIGGAIALELARRGSRIAVIDSVDASAAAERVSSLEAASGSPVPYYQCDVRDRRAVDAAVDDLGPVDTLVACAAIAGSHPFLDLSEQVWADTIDINLTGTFNVGQATARSMIRHDRRGVLVFIGSWVQAIPWPDITAYTVSKAGVEMLARQMARELAAHGIRVNVVAPGIVDAGLAKQQRQDDPKYAERIGKVIPLGQLQTAEQVAKVTAFLCSEDADYLTGMTLLADGGASLFQFDQA